MWTSWSQLFIVFVQFTSISISSAYACAQLHSMRHHPSRNAIAATHCTHSTRTWSWSYIRNGDAFLLHTTSERVSFACTNKSRNRSADAECSTNWITSDWRSYPCGCEFNHLMKCRNRESRVGRDLRGILPLTRNRSSRVRLSAFAISHF